MHGSSAPASRDELCRDGLGLNPNTGVLKMELWGGVRDKRGDEFREDGAATVPRKRDKVFDVMRCSCFAAHERRFAGGAHQEARGHGGRRCEGSDSEITDLARIGNQGCVKLARDEAFDEPRTPRMSISVRIRGESGLKVG